MGKLISCADGLGDPFAALPGRPDQATAPTSRCPERLQARLAARTAFLKGAPGSVRGRQRQEKSRHHAPSASRLAARPLRLRSFEGDAGARISAMIFRNSGTFVTVRAVSGLRSAFLK